MTDPLSTLAIIGGTGALGGALARRWAGAGYPVVLGSRSASRAAQAARTMAPGGGAPAVRGLDNAAAAAIADIVVVTVPFASHAAILGDIREAVQGKLVVDATVPLVPPKVATVRMPPEGAAALAARRILGDGVDVVAAFQNVAAHRLAKDAAIDCDVLVCGDRAAARDAVIALTRALGLRGLHAGPLANAVAVEALTSVLISINRRYKVDGSGVRITGDLVDAAGG